MDPSTSLSFLLGNLRLAESEISADNWVDLLHRLVDRMKGRIKYFDYFQELSKQLNDGGSSLNGLSRDTNMTIIEMDGKINEKTRFIELYRSIELCRILVDELELCKVHYQILFMDKKGEFFGFVGNYKKIGVDSTKMDSSTISIIDGFIVPYDVSDLINFFELYPQSPLRILKTLTDALGSAVQRTSGRLRDQRTDLQDLTNVLMRIQR